MNREAVNADLLLMDRVRPRTVNRLYGFTPGWMLATLLSIPLVATLFWWLGSSLFASRLSLFDFQQLAVLIAGATAGGYQLYFWIQRNNRHLAASCLELPVDGLIAFRPRWIWIYSIGHYAMTGLTILSLQSLGAGVNLVFGGLMVLVAGCAIFYFFPTETPASFRSYEAGCLSARYLAFIQTMDSRRNAFPSMHCAMATYAGLMLVPTIGPWLGYGYIGLLAASCLYVKQHVLADIVGGIVLGLVVFNANAWLVTLS